MIHYLQSIRNINIPLTFDQLNLEISLNLSEIYRVSKKMRPGRFTILDNISEDNFIKSSPSFIFAVLNLCIAFKTFNQYF